MENHEIRPFQIRSASQGDYACLNEVKNALQHEVLPEDPPMAYGEAVQRWQAMPTYVDEATWAAWESETGRISAFGEAKIYLTGDNEHVLNFSIEVLAQYRRQGLGRQMLRRITDQARRFNRRLMIAEANSKVPAGAAFLSGMGARKGPELQMNQLQVDELDRGLIRQWLEQSGHLSGEFRLGWWSDRYPEERIQELADLLQITYNDQPRDGLEVEDEAVTPDLVRQSEEATLVGGRERWVLYVVDRERDRMAGLTEVHWDIARPAILSQDFTGILPEYRGKGLGHWLKAEMMNKVLRERPQVKVIRTGNANTNVPMMKINAALGFKPYMAWTVWQVETQAVAEYLAGRG